MFINIFIQNSLFVFAPITIERERKLLHLSEAVDDINVNRLQVCRCRGVVSCEPSDIELPELVWSSSKPEFASVDNTGVVNGIQHGETIITVSVKENPAVCASCKVIVDITTGIEDTGSFSESGYIIENNKLIITADLSFPVTILSIDGKVASSGFVKEVFLQEGIYILHLNGKFIKLKI